MATKEDYIHIRVTDEEKIAVKKFTKKTKLRTMSLAMLLATEFAAARNGWFMDWLQTRGDE